MIIDDFNVERPFVIVWPLKADAPFLINADAVLPPSVAA
jgi:hypothetical protein